MDHDRHPAAGRGLQRRLERGHDVLAGRVRPQARLHADDHVRIRLDDLDRIVDADVPEVLQLTDQHGREPEGADVQEREDPDLAPIDRQPPEGTEILEPRAAGIDGCRHAAAGIDPRVDAVGRVFPPVAVEVDQPGRDDGAADVLDPRAARATGRQQLPDRAVGDDDIERAVEGLGGVDDPPAA